MENLSRRSLLRLSGYLTGGLVLPLAGTKALALVNPGQAETVAVTPVAMPVSDDLATFRALAREYSDLRYETWYGGKRPRGITDQEIVDTILSPSRRRVDSQAAMILQRSAPSWGDVGELAEIAWLAAPKDDCPIRRPSGQLKRGFWRRSGPEPHDFVHEDDLSLSANAALIEAVLTLTGGQRFNLYRDPL
jgi:hypothetical protein